MVPRLRHLLIFQFLYTLVIGLMCLFTPRTAAATVFRSFADGHSAGDELTVELVMLIGALQIQSALSLVGFYLSRELRVIKFLAASTITGNVIALIVVGSLTSSSAWSQSALYVDVIMKIVIAAAYAIHLWRMQGVKPMPSREAGAPGQGARRRLDALA